MLKIHQMAWTSQTKKLFKIFKKQLLFSFKDSGGMVILEAMSIGYRVPF